MVGCAFLNSNDPELVVRGAIVQPLEMTVLPSNPIPYWDKRLVLRIESPKELAGQLLAVSVLSGWGSKAKAHGYDARLEATTGVIELRVRKSYIVSDPSGPLSVNADKIRLTSWPNKSPEATPNTRPAVPPSSSAGAPHL